MQLCPVFADPVTNIYEMKILYNSKIVYKCTVILDLLPLFIIICKQKNDRKKPAPRALMLEIPKET